MRPRDLWIDRIDALAGCKLERGNAVMSIMRGNAIRGGCARRRRAGNDPLPGVPGQTPKERARWLATNRMRKHRKLKQQRQEQAQA